MKQNKKSTYGDSHSSASPEKWYQLSHINTHQSHTNILSTTFLMLVVTIQCSNYSGQESKKHNLRLMSCDTRDLETRSGSSNVVWSCRPYIKLKPCKVWKTSHEQCPQKSQHHFCCCCCKSGNMSIVSFEYMQFHHLLLFLGWYIHDLVDIITTVESFSPM